ncbi:hypothetical protein [Caulobacter sp. S45]|uniref:hypothetical protein n=1 Tax=Caulobacter sp. S45 TaxID=1641861 RepID=UPI00131D82EC|nr:hypothetical protein [Caulobacter sp. S45]
MIQTETPAAPPPAIPRMLPVVTPSGLPRLPLTLVIGYIAITFLLFLIWPINWPIYRGDDWARLIGYVALCVLTIGGAAWAGSTGPTRVTAPLPYLTPLLVLGATASLLLLAPTSYAYTGRPPWDVLDALRDQGAAYKMLQVHLTTTAGQHMGVALLRAAFAPLVYAALPLGILRWRDIGWIGRLALPVTAASSVVFSIMRGTDKEIADLFVIGVSAAFVSYGRHWASTQSGLEVFRRHWRWGLVAVVFVYLAQGLYTERKEERLNVAHFARTTVCANATNICADLDNPWIAWLPPHQRFGLTLFILSTCSGYYGLDLALDKPFEPAFGVGHSPVALAAYEALTRDPTPHQRTYTYRNGENGWSEEHYWSSLVTWIANDVGFVGALPVLAVIGLMWGIWWREAAAGMSDPAAVLFALATGMMFYFPANNQVFLTPDGYAELAVWIPIWLWHRRGRTLSAAVITSPEARSS